jgi:hypothetical protein
MERGKEGRKERSEEERREGDGQVVVTPSNANERLRKVLLLVGGEVSDGRDVATVQVQNVPASVPRSRNKSLGRKGRNDGAPEGNDQNLVRPSGPVRHNSDEVLREVDDARSGRVGVVEREFGVGVGEEKGGEGVGAFVNGNVSVLFS